MRKRSSSFSFILALIVSFAPANALATDGYFPHGYGIVAKGMGGASTAVCTDAMAGAVNPAKMSFAGSSLEVGLDLFSPQRSASRVGNPFGLNGAADSGSTMFAVPEFGFSWQMSPKLNLGVDVLRQRRHEHDYPGGQIAAGTCGPGMPAANLLCGVGSLGVDLSQMIVAPTLAYSLTPHHAIGVSPLIGYQRFKAEGAQAFTRMSIDPGGRHQQRLRLVDGLRRPHRLLRPGVRGRVDRGGLFAPKMAMGEFDKYRGLFAEEGDFDIPPTSTRLRRSSRPGPDRGGRLPAAVLLAT